MFESLFKDFSKEEGVSKELCQKYSSCVPSDIIKVWQDYGFGSFFDGYLRVINPDDYKELLNDTYFRGNISVPVFVTAFGDILTWEENRYMRIVKYKNGINKGMASGFDFFWKDLETGVFNERFFDIKKYKEAVNRIGNLNFDECFGYVPLLGLGGSERVENLKKVKIREHIELIAQLVGKIGM